MAEALIVVAIIAVLGGVSAIAVQRHQRSLALMERNAIAKEIFIAAQNHLTMAESQGYMTQSESVDFGENVDNKPYEYYILSSSQSAFLYEQMLPFGSIDETVRAGGTYLIHYITNPATILDVFYWTPEGTRFGGSVDVEKDLHFGKGADNGAGKTLVGWYGGTGNAIDIGPRLKNPTIEVENAERLIVKVTNPNETGSLKLIITGKDEDGKDKAMASVEVKFAGESNNRVISDVSDSFTVVLDDITQAGMHFASLLETSERWFDIAGTFVPGEDITVKAVAYDNTTLTNIAYSNEWTVNSLFADVEETLVNGVSQGKIAVIDNIRHLENLNALVSKVDLETLGIDEARQSADLGWSGADSFTVKIAEAVEVYNAATDVMIYKWDNDSADTKPGCLLPVSLDSAFTYDGGIEPANEEVSPMVPARYHSISGVKVDTCDAEDTPAGLFGAQTETMTVKNLALIDFDITGSGSAGALAGVLASGSTVTNVVAYHTAAYAGAGIVSKGGNAGGLIGELAGAANSDTQISKCAAAMIVSTEADEGCAGGLIGAVTSTGAASVSGCYAGGHTANGRYTGTATTEAVTGFNVTGATFAGGLVGNAGNAKITYSYSTCSVSGATAGGLVGLASGDIENCYATGLVSGSAAGAFAGEYTGTAKNCLYYSIINGDMFAVSSDTADMDPREDIVPLDADTLSYIDFIETANPTALEWLPKKVASLDAAYTDAEGAVHAANYDPTLAKYYPSNNVDGENKTLAVYILRTVAQLGATVTQTPQTDEDGNTPVPADFVATHYGDWPAPETFVINTPTGGSGS